MQGSATLFSSPFGPAAATEGRAHAALQAFAAGGNRPRGRILAQLSLQSARTRRAPRRRLSDRTSRFFCGPAKCELDSVDSGDPRKIGQYVSYSAAISLGPDAGNFAAFEESGGGGAGGRGGRPRVRLGGHDESDEEAADAGDEEESIEAQRGFGRWLTEYNRLLEKYPLTTKALTAAVFCSVGDVACQWLEAQSVRVPLDVPRVGRFAVVGLVLNGPSHHIWYHWLEKVIPVACNKSLLLKLAVDESVFAPFSVWAFFVLMSALEGKGPAFMAARLRSEFKHTLAADLGLWIPAQLINFKFVPSHYTALYMDAIGLGWAVYLSFAAKRSSGSAAPAHGHGH